MGLKRKTECGGANWEWKDDLCWKKLFTWGGWSSGNTTQGKGKSRGLLPPGGQLLQKGKRVGGVRGPVLRGHPNEGASVPRTKKQKEGGEKEETMILAAWGSKARGTKKIRNLVQKQFREERVKDSWQGKDGCSIVGKESDAARVQGKEKRGPLCKNRGGGNH